MTDQQTPETEHDDDVDDFPTVRFALRNTDGDASELKLRTHTLGLDRYLLVKPGADAVELECSHMTLDDLALTLGFLTATVLQADGISADTLEAVVELVTGAAQELDEGETSTP